MTAAQGQHSVMYATRRQWLAMATASIAVAGWARPAHALWQDNAAHYPALSAFLEDYVSSRRLPGVAAAIGKSGLAPEFLSFGKVAFDASKSVDGDTLWRLYSMTKPVTGIATMMLIDRGLLRLDQPLSDIMPAFASMRVLTRADGPVDETEPARTAITIRHLLTHTAGLGYSIVQSGPIKAAYEAAGVVPGQVSRMTLPGLSRGTPAPSLEAFADRLATLPLVYQPGTRWSYSVSLDLLGRVIELVAGVPFDQFLAREIFEPLGMRDTVFQVRDDQVERLVTNYAPFGGTVLPIDPAAASIYRDRPAFPFGGAGLVGSARDYDRFLWMLANRGTLDGVRILSETTAQTAMSNLLPEGTATGGTFVEGAGFGAGGRVTLPDSPTGGGIYGWAGAAGTIAFVDPARGIRFGAYANYMPSEAYPFQRDVTGRFLADLMAAAH